MVRFRIKVNEKQKLAYIPKEIVEALGFKLVAIPNAKALLLFPEGEKSARVIESVKIILQDLELAMRHDESLSKGPKGG